MIKGYFAPSVTVMAIYASRFLVKFSIEDRFMYIFMAIVTPYSYLAETPSVALFMTGETGCSQVSAG